MRNLRNIRFSRWDSAAACPGEALTSVCIDAAADDLLCTLGPSEHGRIRLVRMSERAEEASLRVYGLPNRPESGVACADESVPANTARSPLGMRPAPVQTFPSTALCGCITSATAPPRV